MSVSPPDPVLQAAIKEYLQKPKAEHRNKRHIGWRLFDGRELLATTKRMLHPSMDKVALCVLVREAYRKTGQATLQKPSRLKLASYGCGVLPAVPDALSPDLCPLCATAYAIAALGLLVGGE